MREVVVAAVKNSWDSRCIKSAVAVTSLTGNHLVVTMCQLDLIKKTDTLRSAPDFRY